MVAEDEIAGVGPRIRQLRDAAGYSREEFARLVGISPSGVEVLEREGSNPKLTTLVGVARTLGVTIDDLLNPTDVGERLRLIRLLADPGETPDDLALATMRYLRRLMAELHDK